MHRRYTRGMTQIQDDEGYAAFRLANDAPGWMLTAALEIIPFDVIGLPEMVGVDANDTLYRVKIAR